MPVGDYEIVAMFDKEEETKDTNSYRRPRLASYRHPDDGKLCIICLIKEHMTITLMHIEKFHFKKYYLF